MIIGAVVVLLLLYIAEVFNGISKRLLYSVPS